MALYLSARSRTSRLPANMQRETCVQVIKYHRFAHRKKFYRAVQDAHRATSARLLIHDGPISDATRKILAECWVPKLGAAYDSATDLQTRTDAIRAEFASTLQSTHLLIDIVSSDKELLSADSNVNASVRVLYIKASSEQLADARRQRDIRTGAQEEEQDMTGSVAEPLLMCKRPQDPLNGGLPFNLVAWLSQDAGNVLIVYPEESYSSIVSLPDDVVTHGHKCGLSISDVERDKQTVKILLPASTCTSLEDGNAEGRINLLSNWATFALKTLKKGATRTTVHFCFASSFVSADAAVEHHMKEIEGDLLAGQKGWNDCLYVSRSPSHDPTTLDPGDDLYFIWSWSRIVEEKPRLQRMSTCGDTDKATILGADGVGDNSTLEIPPQSQVQQRSTNPSMIEGSQPTKQPRAEATQSSSVDDRLGPNSGLPCDVLQQADTVYWTPALSLEACAARKSKDAPPYHDGSIMVPQSQSATMKTLATTGAKAQKRKSSHPQHGRLSPGSSATTPYAPRPSSSCKRPKPTVSPRRTSDTTPSDPTMPKAPQLSQPLVHGWMRAHLDAWSGLHAGREHPGFSVDDVMNMEQYTSHFGDIDGTAEDRLQEVKKRRRNIRDLLKKDINKRFFTRVGDQNPPHWCPGENVRIVHCMT